MTDVEKLKADLLADFTRFQEDMPPGGSDEANEIVAERLAESICKAIKDGSKIRWKGSATVSEMNVLQPDEKAEGDIYLVTDSGVLVGESPLEVQANTIVMWDGASWMEYMRIDLSNYYTKAETQAVVGAEASARTAADTALGVRIDSLGDVYETKADAKAKAEAYGLEMAYANTNTLKFYRPVLG